MLFLKAQIPLGIVALEVVLGEGGSGVACGVETVAGVDALLAGDDLRHDAESAVGELLDAPELFVSASIGGYLGNTYFKIVIEGTERALAATADREVTTVPAYTGDDAQLWRIEQLTDGTFRIMPKAIPGREGINTHICLYSAGDSTPTLAEYDFNSDNSKWNFRKDW